MTYKEFQFVSTKRIMQQIARSLDPKAFTNADKADMARRKDLVMRRVARAMEDYYRREVICPYSAGISDEDIPW